MNKNKNFEVEIDKSTTIVGLVSLTLNMIRQIEMYKNDLNDLVIVT